MDHIGPYKDRFSTGFHLVKMTEELLKEYFRLQASEIGTQAQVYAVTKREMGIMLPGDIELERVVKYLLIKVRGAIQHDHSITCLDFLTTYFRIARRCATKVM